MKLVLMFKCSYSLILLTAEVVGVVLVVNILHELLAKNSKGMEVGSHYSTVQYRGSRNQLVHIY